MTMALISERDQKLFTHTGWRMLIGLALRSGWQPAGARAPVPGPVEDEDGDDGVVDLGPQLPQAGEAPEDCLLAQVFQSLLSHSGNPVLDSYFNNAGLRVTAQDARALAEALERALPDIPSHGALDHKAVTTAGAPGELFLRFGTPVNAFEWFSGQNRKHLKEFIAFCREGGFEIW